MIVPIQEAGRLLMSQDMDAAAWDYRKTLFLARWMRGISVKEQFDAYMGLGLFHHVHGKYAKAARIWKRALALAERRIAPVSIEAATALDRLVYASMARAEVQATSQFNYNGGWNNVRTGSHGRMLWQAAFERSPYRAEGLEYLRRRDALAEQLETPPG